MTSNLLNLLALTTVRILKCFTSLPKLNLSFALRNYHQPSLIFVFPEGSGYFAVDGTLPLETILRHHWFLNWGIWILRVYGEFQGVSSKLIF